MGRFRMGFLLSALFVTFLSRVAYFVAFPIKNLDTDSVNHLYLVKAIRANRGHIPERISQYLFDFNDYPNGFHKVMAALPISLERFEKHGGLVPIVMDTALLALAGFVVMSMGGRECLWLLLFPLARLLWGYEMRAFLFGERAYGVFFGNLYLVASVFWSQTHHPGWAFLAVLSCVVFSTSSLFTVQAVTFFTLLATVMLAQWDYLALYGVSIMLSALLTGGYSVRVLAGLCRHVYFYKTHIMKTNWGIRHFYGQWLTVFRRFRLSHLVHLLYENSLAKGLTNVPMSVPFWVLWAQHGFPLEAWTVYGLSGLILLPLIATEPLKFLGEPERYLEYSIVPMLVFLSAFPVANHPWLFGSAMAIGLSAVVFQLRLKRRTRQQAVEQEADYAALETLLRSLPEGTILPIPQRIAYRTGYTVNKHRYVAFFINVGAGEDYARCLDLLPDHFGFPGPDLERYQAQYAVDYVLFHKVYYAHMDKARLHGAPYYDFSGYTLLYDSPFFQCYRVSSTPLKTPPLYSSADGDSGRIGVNNC